MTEQRHFRFPLCISRAHGLKAAEHFAAIGRHYPAGGDRAYATLSDLADVMGVSTRTVQRRTNRATAAGWLRIHKRRGKSDRYQLILDGQKWIQGRDMGEVWVTISPALWNADKTFPVRALLAYAQQFPTRKWRKIADDLGMSEATLKRCKQRAIEELGWLRVERGIPRRLIVDLPDYLASNQDKHRAPDPDPLDIITARWPDLPPDLRSTILRLAEGGTQ